MSDVVPKLPPELFCAFEWTAAAGELAALRAIRRGWDLADYAMESAKNYASHTGDPQDAHAMASNLYGLNKWLRYLTDEQFRSVMDRQALM